MIREKVLEKVKKVTADLLGCTEDEVTEEASFTADLGADSLDALELCMEIEKEFKMSIPDVEFEKIHTVGELVAYIMDHQPDNAL